MDGFASQDGEGAGAGARAAEGSDADEPPPRVLVVGVTNRADALDEALLRPGSKRDSYSRVVKRPNPYVPRHL